MPPMLFLAPGRSTNKAAPHVIGQAGRDAFVSGRFWMRGGTGRVVHAPYHGGVPYGSRTRVASVKGRCPRPLDERDALWGTSRLGEPRTLAYAKSGCQTATTVSLS